jgi:hypothetical protein
MPTDFNRIRISRLIAHKVFKRKSKGDTGESETPSYKSRLTPLNEETSSVLIQRIKAATESPYFIEYEPKNPNENVILSKIKEMFSKNESDFIADSHFLVEKLWEAQTSPGIPTSVVIVVQGQIGVIPRNCIFVVKAEEDSGYVADETDEMVGLNPKKDLLLTHSQNFQKFALFIEDENSVQIFALDPLARGTDGVFKATYFIERFMKCVSARNSKNDSQAIYNAIAQVIEKPSIGLTVSERFELSNSLISYTLSNSPTISVQAFADEYIRKAEQKEAVINLVNDATGIHVPIEKDLTLLSRKLAKQEIRFDNKIKIIGPYEAISAHIEIENEEDDDSIYTIVRIRGKKLVDEDD